MSHTVTVAPYGAQVTFIRSKVEWHRVTGEKPATGVCGLCCPIDSGWLVGVFKGGLSTLIHECVHAAMFIVQFYGMDPTDSNGEQVAYLTEWLVQQGRQKGRA